MTSGKRSAASTNTLTKYLIHNRNEEDTADITNLNSTANNNNNQLKTIIIYLFAAVKILIVMVLVTVEITVMAPTTHMTAFVTVVLEGFTTTSNILYYLASY